jgi:hypothetical protein
MDLDGPLTSVWQAGHVAAGDLWSYYRRYPYLTRLRDRAVLEGALRAALDEMMWELEGFAFADRFDAATGTYKNLASYHGGSMGQVHDQVLVVHPKVAAAQQQKAAAAASTTAADGAATVPPAKGAGATSAPETAETPAAPNVTRFYGAVSVNPERYGRDFTRWRRKCCSTWPPWTERSSRSAWRSPPGTRTASLRTRSVSCPRTRRR